MPRKISYECLFAPGRFFNAYLRVKPVAFIIDILRSIVNDDSRRMTVQVVVSLTIVILMTLEVSFTLLENIYSRGGNHDDRNKFIVQVHLSYP